MANRPPRLSLFPPDDLPGHLLRRPNEELDYERVREFIRRF